ncbi:hypothetical protein [Micromonospora sp. NPDC049799]|uniref:hypothetical protein n=1 Tax=Micromonospora sp. NPDC049799 TaxID=3154741 RepID=UPI0033DE4180
MVKRIFLLLAGTAVLLAFTGCQRALNVGAVNRCGHPIEIVGDSASELRQSGWVSMGEGQRWYVLSAAESTDRLYVWVRRPDAQQPMRFEIAVAELPRPPADATSETRIDREIVVEGDRCPAR